jgi:hypothetical protein
MKCADRVLTLASVTVMFKNVQENIRTVNDVDSLLSMLLYRLYDLLLRYT